MKEVSLISALLLVIVFSLFFLFVLSMIKTFEPKANSK